MTAMAIHGDEREALEFSFRSIRRSSNRGDGALMWVKHFNILLWSWVNRDALASLRAATPQKKAGSKDPAFTPNNK